MKFHPSPLGSDVLVPSTDFWTFFAGLIDETCLSDFFEALLAGMMIGSYTRNPHQRNFMLCSYLFVMLTIPSTSGMGESDRGVSLNTMPVPRSEKMASAISSRIYQGKVDARFLPVHLGCAARTLRLRGFGPKQGKSGGKKGAAKASKPAGAATAASGSFNLLCRPRRPMHSLRTSCPRQQPPPKSPRRIRIAPLGRAAHITDSANRRPPSKRIFPAPCC